MPISSPALAADPEGIWGNVLLAIKTGGRRAFSIEDKPAGWPGPFYDFARLGGPHQGQPRAAIDASGLRTVILVARHRRLIGGSRRHPFPAIDKACRPSAAAGADCLYATGGQGPGPISPPSCGGVAQSRSMVLMSGPGLNRWRNWPILACGRISVGGALGAGGPGAADAGCRRTKCRLGHLTAWPAPPMARC